MINKKKGKQGGCVDFSCQEKENQDMIGCGTYFDWKEKLLLREGEYIKERLH
jgi:hypothetical protein